MDLPDPDPEPNLPQTGAKSEPGLNRLWEEYKLIQGKIDKIGDFQFKVKSWSATLLGALLFGGAATARFPVALFSALVITAIFHLSERRQRLLSQRLGRRASAPERAFSELPPVSDPHAWKRILRRIPSLSSVPGIASSIVGDKRERWETERLWEDWRSIGRWLVDRSDDVFYVAQYLLAAALLLWTAFEKAYDLWSKR